MKSKYLQRASKRCWNISILSLLLTGTLFVSSCTKSDPQPIIPVRQSSEKISPPIKTTYPVLSDEFSTVILNGTVMSHESAEVHARREGIVQDIFVDIGDHIRKGQVLATLLPRGVEGESEALIAQKSAEAAKARIEYENALLLEKENINAAIAGLQEKNTQLTLALNTKISTEERATVDVRATDVVTVAKAKDVQQSVRTAEQNLRVAEENLEKANENANTQIDKSDTAVQEASNQGEVALRHALQIANQVIFDQETRDDLVQVRDIPYYYGYNDSQSRIDFTQSVAEFRSMQEESLPEKISSVESILSHLNTILGNSTSGAKVTQEDIDRKIQLVHNAEDKLAAAKEKYRLAVSSEKTVTSEQGKEIVRLEGKVTSDLEMLASAKIRLQLIESQNEEFVDKAKANEAVIFAAESEKVEMLKKQVDVAQENVGVIKAAQKRNTDAARTLLDIANSALSTQLSKSGHVEIISPFEGKITRRDIAVGDMIDAQKPAFELIAVSSELSQQSRGAVHFGIPEHLTESISSGSTVEIALHRGMFSHVWKTGIIVRKSETTDPVSRLMEAQAEFSEEIALPHNATVRVRIVTSDPSVWKVRSLAVKREDGKNVLYVLSKGGMKKIPIEVFSEDGEWAHIVGNISEETEIILSPPKNFNT